MQHILTDRLPGMRLISHMFRKIKPPVRFKTLFRFDNGLFVVGNGTKNLSKNNRIIFSVHIFEVIRGNGNREPRFVLCDCLVDLGMHLFVWFEHGVACNIRLVHRVAKIESCATTHIQNISFQTFKKFMTNIRKRTVRISACKIQNNRRKLIPQSREI